jgi:hypothetical protein
MDINTLAKSIVDQATVCRVHKTLRVTPAMEAGVAHHVWTVEELVAAIIPEPVAKKRGTYKPQEVMR